MPIRRIAPSTAATAAASASCCRASIAAIGDGLLAGALRALQEAGVAERDITVVTVPGALETPLALQRLAQIGRLRRAGRARRGDPRRDLPFRDRRQRIGARACRASQLEFGIPIGNGILTSDTDAQALARAGRQGLRGGAGGARAREPAATRSMTTMLSARAAARASSCCRASTSGSCRATTPTAIARAARREPRASRSADAAVLRRAVGTASPREYDALVAALAPHLDRKRRGAVADRARDPRHRRVGARAPARNSLQVVINEAVELAKSYGGTDGHKFVNGVLDKLAADAARRRDRGARARAGDRADRDAGPSRAALPASRVAAAVARRAAGAVGALARRLLQPRPGRLRARRADVHARHRHRRRRSSRKPTGEFYAQIRAERDNPKADVWYGGTIDPFLQGAAEGLFAPYRSPRLAELHPWAQRQATERPATGPPRSTGSSSASAPIRRCSRRRSSPRRAAGRTSSKPDYRKEIELSNPVTSGTGYTILATLVALYGEDGAFDYLKRLAPERRALHAVGHRAGAVGRARRGGRRRDLRPRVRHAAARGLSRSTSRFPCEGTGDALGGMAIIAGGPQSGRGARVLRLGAHARRAGARQPHAQPDPARQRGGRDPARGGALRRRARRSTSTRRNSARRPRTQAAARALAARDRRCAECASRRRASPIIRRERVRADRALLHAAAAIASVRLGVGDDAALVAPAPGCELAVSVDMLVEGRHFLADVDPETLGHKTLAVNLSDMAAMGATPRWALLAGALPDVDAAWLAAFARGFFALADAHGVDAGRRRHDARAAQPVRDDHRRSAGGHGADARRRAAGRRRLRVGHARRRRARARRAARAARRSTRDALAAARARLETPEPRVALGDRAARRGHRGARRLRRPHRRPRRTSSSARSVGATIELAARSALAGARANARRRRARARARVPARRRRRLRALLHRAARRRATRRGDRARRWRCR